MPVREQILPNHIIKGKLVQRRSPIRHPPSTGRTFCQLSAGIRAGSWRAVSKTNAASRLSPVCLLFRAAAPWFGVRQLGYSTFSVPTPSRFIALAPSLISPAVPCRGFTGDALCFWEKAMVCQPELHYHSSKWAKRAENWRSTTVSPWARLRWWAQRWAWMFP